MKRVITLVLALALIAGAGLAQAAGRSGGGAGHGGGSGGHMGSGGHPGTGGHPGVGAPPAHFSGGGFHMGQGFGHPIVRPPIVVGRPFPHHRVIVTGTVVVGSPFFWWPPYPYAYVPPVYGGPIYSEPPTYIEQGQVYYYCPDYQDYYPNVPSCPSPWVQVVPGASAYPN